MIDKGFGAPYAKAITQSGVIIECSRFSYVDSEKLDDSSKLTIESGDLSVVDNPELQEGSRLILMWGYNGSDEFRSQIVYIWDPKPSFNENGVRLELSCFCKAAYLSLASGKDIFNGMSLQDIVEQFAESNGLNYKEELKKSIDRFNANFDVIKTGGETISSLDYKTGQKTVARDATTLKIEYVTKKYPAGFVQAGGSPAKLMEEMVANEPTDNIVIDGRDDDITIRIRDLGQKPFKSYTFRAEPGYLLDIQPGSKNDQFKKEGVSNNVSGWSEEDKEFIEGEINRTHSTAEALSNTVDVTPDQLIVDKIYKENNNPTDRPLFIGGFFENEYQGKDENGNPFYKRKFVQKLDTTKNSWVHIVKRGVRPSQLDLQKGQMTAAIDNTGIQTQGYIGITPKEIVRTVETAKEDIAGKGVNKQSNAELNIYQGSARIMGDIELQSSKVITILGIGNKYSGNYYLESVTHEITAESGYICYCSLLKTGYNSVGGETKDKVKTNTYNIPYNQKNINNPSSIQDMNKELIDTLVNDANRQDASKETVVRPLKKIKKAKPNINGFPFLPQ